MSRVEEIERAIQGANRAAVYAIEQERWDEELDRDAGAGRLDFLIAEAREDRANGRLTDWPMPE